MTSHPQQPRQAAQQPPRFFVAFKFRLHGHTHSDGTGNSRRLDRQVMSKGEDEGLDGVESTGEFVGLCRHGRSVVRCDLMFDQEGES